MTLARGGTDGVDHTQLLHARGYGGHDPGEVLRGLGGLHDEAYLALERQRVRIGSATHDLRVITSVAQDALHLGMARLAHDKYAIALAHQPLGGHVDLLDVRAGGVDDVKATLAGSIDHLRHHAVGADDHGARRCVVQGFGQANAYLIKLAHHDGVMDERTQGVNLSALPCLRCGGQRHIERTLYAVASAGVGGDLDGRSGYLVGRSLGGVRHVLAHC